MIAGGIQRVSRGANSGSEARAYPVRDGRSRARLRDAHHRGETSLPGPRGSGVGANWGAHGLAGSVRSRRAARGRAGFFIVEPNCQQLRKSRICWMGASSSHSSVVSCRWNKLPLPTSGPRSAETPAENWSSLLWNKKSPVAMNRSEERGFAQRLKRCPKHPNVCCAASGCRFSGFGR